MIKENEFDFKRKILYPACVAFFVLVFVYFLIAMAAGINVTESGTGKFTQYYDGETDSGSIDSDTAAPAALPVQTLLGLLLFSLSVMSLRYVYNLKISRILARLIHYIGTILSFLIFVIALSGVASSTEVPIVLFALFAVSLIYFLLLGLSVLFKKLMSGKKISKKIIKIRDFTYFTLACFTAVVFCVSIFALITKIKAIVTVTQEKNFVTDKAFYETVVTAVTPLAPTVQNYLRYLATAAVFAFSYAVLFTCFKRPVKVIFNFLILTAGYVVIWILGLDYFRLIKSNILPAVIIYLSVYLVALITVCIVLYVKRQMSEEKEDYESQFSVGKKTKKNSDG